MSPKPFNAGQWIGKVANQVRVTWTPGSTNAEQAARELVSAVLFLHSTFKDEVWLWRGQANKAYDLTPAMHSRVRVDQVGAADNVARATDYLIRAARSARLDDTGSGFRLPDLALLAHLQHHGAATPLLDVTFDPLVALWFVAFGDPADPPCKDHVGGSLFAIKKPPVERHIAPLDSLPFWSASESLPSIQRSIGEDVWWYDPPDVTERLRIQRGSFILGNPVGGRIATSLPLRTTSASNWLAYRMERRGLAGNTKRADTDVAVFNVRGSVKKHLRDLLADRSGLDPTTIYPTPWENPFVEQFATAHGRSRPLGNELTSEDAEAIRYEIRAENVSIEHHEVLPSNDLDAK